MAYGTVIESRNLVFWNCIFEFVVRSVSFLLRSVSLARAKHSYGKVLTGVFWPAKGLALTKRN
jgi:hypothetical protein